MANRLTTAHGVNVLASVRSGPPREHFIIVWADGQSREAVRQLGRWAANPELSFSWYDAAVSSQRIAERLQAGD